MQQRVLPGISRLHKYCRTDCTPAK